MAADQDGAGGRSGRGAVAPPADLLDVGRDAERARFEVDGDGGHRGVDTQPRQLHPFGAAGLGGADLGHVVPAAAEDERRGDIVTVDSRRYRVTTVKIVRKDALPSSIYTRTGPARLVLVTCGGPFNAKAGHYRDNVIVTATPVR